MEGNFRSESSSLPVLADLTATQGCEDELSRSDSDFHSNSSFTVENSDIRLHQIEDSPKDCLTAWTDEKHDLYLDNLESLFVEQLHRSIGVLAWCSEHDSKGPYLSQKLQAKTQNTSQQHKMIHGDCSEKIDLKRRQPGLNHAAPSIVLLKSHPRFAGKQHFVRAGKLQDRSAAWNPFTEEEKLFLNETELHSDRISARCGKSLEDVGEHPEFSDQNFADEASEQTRATSLKRSKTIVSEI